MYRYSLTFYSPWPIDEEDIRDQIERFLNDDTKPYGSNIECGISMSEFKEEFIKNCDVVPARKSVDEFPADGDEYNVTDPGIVGG